MAKALYDPASVYGKVLGAMVGLAAGLLLSSGPLALVLAAVGLVAGHLIFDREDPPSPEKLKSIDELLTPEPRAAVPLPPKPVPRTNPDSVIAKMLCPIFVEVARSDGPVTREEVRVVREYFQNERGFGEESLEQVRLALKKALAGKPIELAEATKKVRAKLTPAERPLFVNALYELALIDGSLKRAESDSIKQVVGALNLSDEQLQTITAMHLGSGTPHYRALGLSESASDDEIRSAFRKLAAENHPDRAKGEGAAEKFRAINDAYQELRKLRGL
jgi:DnaJ like chaperone protein